jgi:hypothetical protein
MQSELRRNDSDFKASGFELILHEMFISLGHEVKVHPELNGGNNRRVDFLVLMKTGEKFVVEAKVVKDKSDTDEVNEARMNERRDRINKQPEDSNFYIDAHIKP